MPKKITTRVKPETVEWVKDQLLRAELSKSEIARRTRLHRHTITRIESDRVQYRRAKRCKNGHRFLTRECLTCAAQARSAKPKP